MAVLKQTSVKCQAVYDSTKPNNSEIAGCIWQY